MHHASETSTSSMKLTTMPSWITVCSTILEKIRMRQIRRTVIKIKIK